MLKFDLQLPLNPLSDRHQIQRALLCHGYLSPRTNWAQSVKRFFYPHILELYTPHVRYATLYECLLLFGSSNRLQPRAFMDFNAYNVNRRGFMQESAS